MGSHLGSRLPQKVQSSEGQGSVSKHAGGNKNINDYSECGRQEGNRPK